MKNLLGLIACDTVTLIVLVDCGNTREVYSLDITGSAGNDYMYEQKKTNNLVMHNTMLY